MIPYFHVNHIWFFLIFFKNTYPTKHEIISVIGNAHQISETPIYTLHVFALL